MMLMVRNAMTTNMTQTMKLFLFLSIALVLCEGLLSLSLHTVARATTVSTVAAFVLPHKDIFSPRCLRRCCYGLRRVVL